MKILFVRHGESTDDLSDSFGGWADFKLTDKGKLQAAKAAAKIAQLGIEFQYVYTSNLQRASLTARIIAKKLGIQVEEMVYLKERNTYGLLTGLNKAEAKAKYPELYNSYEAGQVLGDETIEQLNLRVDTVLNILRRKPFENIIAVTHGKYLNAIVTLKLSKKLVKAHDGGFMLLEFKTNGDVTLVSANGIDLED